jgi:hypothetical protein
MEAQLKAAEEALLKPDLSKISVDGDDIPEALKGKSVRELLERQKSLEEALRMSEASRQEAMTMAQLAANRGSEQPKGEPTAPAPEPPITAEMVAEAFAEDQAQGIAMLQKMNQQAIDRAVDHFGKRLEPLISGSTSAVESQARQKYPDEFELYKDDIEKLISSLPNKSVMSTMQSWDDMIAYVRGRDPLKLYNFMATKEAKKRASEAQASERESVGFQAVGSGSQRTPQGGTGVVFDDTTKEICRVLGISEQEYAKWSRVG